MTLTQEHLKSFSELHKVSEMKNYYDWQLKHSQIVSIVPSSDLSLKDIRDKISSFPVEEHECYHTAFRLCMADPEISYVEGYMEVHGVPIAHAWNCWRGIHFDLTEEKLGSSIEHIAIQIYSSKKAIAFGLKTGHSGPYIEESYLNTLRKN